MPNVFKANYPNTRVIIDCTEIAVESSSSLLLKSKFYSSYKSRTTLKCLAGISPSGATSFISTLHAALISDKPVTQVSDFLDLLEDGDQIMADKGFLIDDLLAEKNCSLVIPTFLAQKGQFTELSLDTIKLLLI